MPVKRKPRNFVPLHQIAEKKSVKNGLRHAIFTKRFDKYIGEWKFDKKNGKGRFHTVNGKLYEGDWEDGFRHGFGTLSRLLPDNTYTLIYHGDWVRGKPEGVGWYYYENGDVYFGFFKAGERHGFGKMWHADGTYYVGYWQMSERNGLGMFIQGNGNRYEGNWEGSKKHGRGRFFHLHTGQMQEGCWENDICVKSKMSDIIIRQYCDLPTRFPIPPHGLVKPRKILEQSMIWLNSRLGDIDENLKKCVDLSLFSQRWCGLERLSILLGVPVY